MTPALQPRAPLAPRVRGSLLGLLTFAAVFICAVSATAQGAGPKKKDEGAVLLVLLPLAIFIVGSLQMAVMGFFPRFARRCAAAVGRYRWQTPLIGLVGFLACGLLAAVTNQLTGGSERAGLPVVFAAILVATMGGVGISLPAGRWALKRIGSDAPTHPIIEILAGSSVLGWAMLLVPCVGQLLWIGASCASMGAFIFALVAGRRLDQAPAWERAAPAQPYPPIPSLSQAPEPPAPEPLPRPTQSTNDTSEDSQVF